MTEDEFCITEKTGGSAVSLLSLLGAGRNFFCFGLVFVCVAQTSLSKDGYWRTYVYLCR